VVSGPLGRPEGMPLPRLWLIVCRADQKAISQASRGLRSQRRGPVPTPCSLATGRLAPRSAPVARRGSGRSRRAGPQTQSRPEARIQAQTRVRTGVAWGPEITPHISVETVDNSCVWVNRRRCALRALKRRRRGATLLGRAWAETPRRGGRPNEIGGNTAKLSTGDPSEH
jgi:hypothetical protein